VPQRKSQTNSKSQISNPRVTGIQTPLESLNSLVLDDCLGFGVWDLGFPLLAVISAPGGASAQILLQ
jgi:hypothetical protein